MFLINALKAIGGFFKTVFSGMVGIFVTDFEDVTKQIVELLLFASMPGTEKFKTALAVLEGYAIKQGKQFINHAARLLIELKLFDAQADDPKAKLESLIDLGLERARLAVAAVDEMDLVGDDERRDAALSQLWSDFSAAGKMALLDHNLLYVLIELAVAERRQEAAEPQ